MSKKPTTKKTAKKTAKRAKGKSAGKIALIFSAVLLLIGLGSGLSYYFGLVHMVMGWERPQTHAKLELGKPVLFELPQIRTDLKTGECRSPFLRATVHVQLAPEYLSRLEDAQDQVMDAILTHLRDQERQNVVGKEGSERLRFELVQIIENVISPAKIHTLLFKELVVQ